MKRGLWLVWGTLLLPDAIQAATAPVWPALVLKADGSGLAELRRRSGVVQVVAAGGFLQAGDRLKTDAQANVSVLFPDGTLLKQGANTELVLREAAVARDQVTWRLELKEGSLMGLVDSSGPSKIPLEITTPQGALAVPGGVFFLTTGAASASLAVWNGQARWGEGAMISAGSAMSVSQGKAGALQRLEPKSFFTGVGPLSLLRAVGAKHAVEAADEATLQKALQGSIADFRDRQNAVIGRSETEREERDAAVLNGTIDEIYAAADAFAKAGQLYDPEANGRAEEWVAQVAAAKFRLGQAVKEASEAGVFLDTRFRKTPWKKRPAEAFQTRKATDLEEFPNAKDAAAKLSGALVDFRQAVEYAEVLPSEEESKAKSKACTDSCRAQRAVHEFRVMSEGLTGAFLKKAPASGDGVIATRFFSRAIPGEACFKDDKQEEVCKTKICPRSGLIGKTRCTYGVAVEFCSSRKVPVRCPGK